jgi:hypothetical protein
MMIDHPINDSSNIDVVAEEPLFSVQTHLLFDQFAKSKKTTLVAPLSLDHLIGMIYPLYKDQDQKIILSKVFGTVDERAIVRYLKKTLTDYPTLKIGNCVATNLDTHDLQHHFDQLKVTPFSLNDGEIVSKINDFVSQKTQGLIGSIIQDRRDMPSNGLVAINAGSFIGKFDQPFLPEETRKETFVTEQKEPLTLDMMWGMKLVNYFECDQFQYIELPLENGQYLLKLVLPKEDQSVQEVWHLYPFISGHNLAKRSLVDILLPKFQVSQTTELLGLLASYEIPLLEDTSCGRLTSIMQKTLFELEEGGVKAAFVTSGFFKTSIDKPSPNHKIQFIRPFAFELTTVDFVPIMTGVYNG